MGRLEVGAGEKTRLRQSSGLSRVFERPKQERRAGVAW